MPADGAGVEGSDQAGVVEARSELRLALKAEQARVRRMLEAKKN